ncbi:MAG TPA: hypothetical protein VI197_09270, partial [Polyangiaceae bacterium]
MSESKSSSGHAHGHAQEASDETTSVSLLVAAAALGAFVWAGNADSKVPIHTTESVKHQAEPAAEAAHEEAVKPEGTAPSLAVDDLAVEKEVAVPAEPAPEVP